MGMSAGRCRTGAAQEKPQYQHQGSGLDMGSHQNTLCPHPGEKLGIVFPPREWRQAAEGDAYKFPLTPFRGYHTSIMLCFTCEGRNVLQLFPFSPLTSLLFPCTYNTPFPCFSVIAGAEQLLVLSTLWSKAIKRDFWQF